MNRISGFTFSSSNHQPYSYFKVHILSIPSFINNSEDAFIIMQWKWTREREFRNGKWLSYQSFNFLFKDNLGHNHLQGSSCLQCNSRTDFLTSLYKLQNAINTFHQNLWIKERKILKIKMMKNKTRSILSRVAPLSKYREKKRFQSISSTSSSHLFSASVFDLSRFNNLYPTIFGEKPMHKT